MSDYKCPVHDVDLYPAISIKYGNTNVAIPDELEIFECPVGEELYIIKDYEPVPISKSEVYDLVSSYDKQKKFMTPLEERIERLQKVGEYLSPGLFHLTKESKFHRAYTVDEIVEACDALGFPPKTVEGNMIGAVMSWLKKNKGEEKGGEYRVH